MRCGVRAGQGAGRGEARRHLHVPLTRMVQLGFHRLVPSLPCRHSKRTALLHSAAVRARYTYTTAMANRGLHSRPSSLVPVPLGLQAGYPPRPGVANCSLSSRVVGPVGTTARPWDHQAHAATTTTTATTTTAATTPTYARPRSTTGATVACDVGSVVGLPSTPLAASGAAAGTPTATAATGTTRARVGVGARVPSTMPAHAQQDTCGEGSRRGDGEGERARECTQQRGGGGKRGVQAAEQRMGACTCTALRMQTDGCVRVHSTADRDGRGAPAIVAQGLGRSSAKHTARTATVRPTPTPAVTTPHALAA
jgi:hypothetical protein